MSSIVRCQVMDQASGALHRCRRPSIQHHEALIGTSRVAEN